jgi:hypothetical protein
VTVGFLRRTLLHGVSNPEIRMQKFSSDKKHIELPISLRDVLSMYLSNTRTSLLSHIAKYEALLNLLVP